jgi:hypothetical protein
VPNASGDSHNPTFRETADFTDIRTAKSLHICYEADTDHHGPRKVYTSVTSRTPKTTQCQFPAHEPAAIDGGDERVSVRRATAEKGNR